MFISKEKSNCVQHPLQKRESFQIFQTPYISIIYSFLSEIAGLFRNKLNKVCNIFVYQTIPLYITSNLKYMPLTEAVTNAQP